MSKHKTAHVPTVEEVEALFAQVDETGHSNESNARKQRKHRRKYGVGVEIDPLSGADPSGSSIGKVITRTAVIFVLGFLAIVVVSQVGCGLLRRATTANLAQTVNAKSVSSALRGGVEWGNGFTQFPDEFTVQEADESTGRLEVSVVDNTSRNAMECMAGSQVQASALANNAMLNPQIDTVVYHVYVHKGQNGKFQRAALFGFLKPNTPATPFMTFIWKKNLTADGGFSLTCSISGIDQQTAEQLKDKLTSSNTSLLAEALSPDKKADDQSNEQQSTQNTTQQTQN